MRLSASSHIGAADSKVHRFDDSCDIRELMEAGRCLSMDGGWLEWLLMYCGSY